MDFAPRAKDILKKVGKVDCRRLTQKEFLKIIPKYNVLVVGLGLNINKEALDKAINLKFIATATTGLDHIDTEYAALKGIKVLSLKGETKFLNSITGTAELAFGLILDLMRNISASFDSVKNYKWEREKFFGHNIYGKTLGIVGLGRLGKMVARYGNGFGMKVVATDQFIKNEDFAKAGAKKVSFGKLLGVSDIISIHVHLNNQTRKMFGDNEFAKMKRAAYLINTSRGEIVDDGALMKALKFGRIAGYGADVLSGENDFETKGARHPLIGYAKHHSNVIIVPHLGGATFESREATDIFIAQKLAKML